MMFNGLPGDRFDALFRARLPEIKGTADQNIVKMAGEESQSVSGLLNDSNSVMQQALNGLANGSGMKAPGITQPKQGANDYQVNQPGKQPVPASVKPSIPKGPFMPKPQQPEPQAYPHFTPFQTDPMMRAMTQRLGRGLF